MTLMNGTSDENIYLTGTVVQGSTAAAHVGYAYSDLLLLQPASGSSKFNGLLGSVASRWQKQSKENCAGAVPEIHEFQNVEECTGSALVNAAEKTSAVLTCSKALLNMMPNMYDLAAKRIPTVFHVAYQGIQDENVIVPSMTDIQACRDTGFALLASGSVQEVHDLAVVSHIAAIRSGVPFLHFFDGSRVAFEQANVKLASTETLQKLNQRMMTAEASEASVQSVGLESAEDFANQVEEAMNVSAEVLGTRTRKLFEYTGPEDAEAVIVAVGSFAQVVEEGVRYSRMKDNTKIGVINVRLVRPWSVSHFLAALPKTTRRVCVLDYGTSSNGPLFLDVASSFHSDAQWVTPLLLEARVLIDSTSPVFTPSMVGVVIKNLIDVSPVQNFYVGAAVRGAAQKTHLGPNESSIAVESSTSELTEQVIVWSIKDAERDASHGTQVKTLAADIIGPRLGLQVQQMDYVDVRHSHGQAKRSELRFGPLEIVAEYPIRRAQMILVDHPSLLLLPQYNVVDALETGAKLVVNCDWPVDRFERELPVSVKRKLAERKAQVMVFDSSLIASKVGVPSHELHPWIIQAVVLALSVAAPYEQSLHHFRQIAERHLDLDTGLLFDLLGHSNVQSILHTITYDVTKWATLGQDVPGVLAGGAGGAIMVPALLAEATSTGEPDVAAPVDASASLQKSYEQLLEQLFGNRLAVANTNATESRAEVPRAQSSLESSYGAYVAKLQSRERLAERVNNALTNPEVALSSELRAALGSWHANRQSATSCQKAVDEVNALLAGEAHTHPELHGIFLHRALLPKVSEWIIGGDRWAYDVNSSGIHHIVASKEDVNVLIFDTDLYNEAERVRQAQPSLEVPRRKKDIGLYAMSYGDAFVASISLKASHTQALRALSEADAFKGPSIILAHAPAAPSAPEVAALSNEAVESGRWPLYRWNPDLEEGGEPFTLDSAKLRSELQEFLKRTQNLALLTRDAPTMSKALEESLEYDLKKKSEKIQQEMNQKRLDAQFGNLTAGLNPQLNLLVLYGSDSGNGSGVAELIAKKAEASGCGESRVMEANEFNLAELSEEKHVIFVLSTAGQGEDCANAKHLTGDILASKSSLSGVKYAVFGLGDSHYWGEGSPDSAKYFCKPARDLDEKLKELGATQLVSVGLGDDQADDGYNSALSEWEPKLWEELEVTLSDTLNMDGPPPIIDDDIKSGSNYLRGTIDIGLADETTGKLLPEDTKLTKFHGIYQQDLRSVREELDAKGLERAYSFMIRIGVPGGVATSEQYIAMDSLCSQYANGALKLTTRQAYQFHGVLKRNMKTTMKGINKACMDTLAACGDVNRNVMANPHIRESPAHIEVNKLAVALNAHLKPRTSAYHEIWLDKKPIAGAIDHEPLYGETYLPRKFKIAIAVPPLNDVDVFAHCLGFIAIIENGRLLGWNVTIGGGMGTTHGNKETYPRLSDVMGFCTPDQAVLVAEKVMLVQRDHGNRENRKHARLKYTLEDHGMDWYRGEVEKRCGFKLEAGRPFHFNTNADPYGWKKGYDGSWSYTMFIQNGYIKDEGDYRIKTALREIAEFHVGGEFTLTGTQNIIIGAVQEARKPMIEALLQKYGIDNGKYSAMRLHSMACVALPTCALAMAEAQTYLPTLVGKLEGTLDECGLRHTAITIRMTGCPNGCARPYLAEIAFVGKAPGVYNLYLGGGFAGNRINKMYKEGVNEEQILEILRPMIKRYSVERQPNEHFGDWVIRAGIIEPTLNGHSFWATGKENDLRTPSGTTQIYW